MSVLSEQLTYKGKNSCQGIDTKVRKVAANKQFRKLLKKQLDDCQPKNRYKGWLL